jgi:hypothetical protein
MARELNGTSDYGQVSIDLSGVARITVFYRYYMPTVGSTDGLIVEYGVYPAGSGGGFHVTPDNAVAGWGAFNFDGGSFNNQDASRGAVTTWHAEQFEIDRAQSGAGEILNGYRNGSTLSFTPGGTSDLSANFSSQTLYIGSRSGTSRFLPIRICDLAIWKGVTLNSSDHNNLNAGRRANWPGLSVQPDHYWPIPPDGSGAALIGGIDIAWTGGAAAADPPGLDSLRRSISDRGRSIITHAGARLVDI